MEVISKQTTSRMDVVVVRQFLPSRIEREILAQIFALVCGQCNQSGATCEGDVSEVSLRGIGQRKDPFTGGRQAS